MDELYQELMNQLKNLETSLKSFSEKDAEELVTSDDLKKEMLKQQRAANKLQFDLSKMREGLEADVSSFPGEDAIGAKASTDMSRFASEEVLRQFAGKVKKQLG